MAAGRLRACGVWAAVLAAGCSGASGPAGTGAANAARAYGEALVRRDWRAAYAALHPDIRARCGPEEFARRADHYRRGLGFEPDEVRVRACEERGAEAVAHVLLVGKGRTFREALTLRRAGDDWGVVLPPRFGSSRQ